MPVQGQKTLIEIQQQEERERIEMEMVIQLNLSDLETQYFFFLFHLFFYFFFFSVLRPFQDYFSSYDTGQSVGLLKMGEPQEKPPGTPASRTWHVSHVASVGLEPTPDTAVR